MRVKPLTWEVSREGYASDQWFAQSMFGEYCTYMHAPSGRAWLQGPDGLKQFLTTIDEAKAAAQGHHEARILSAIVPTAESELHTKELLARGAVLRDFIPPAGVESAAQRLYEFVGRLGVHGSIPAAWRKRSEEHKQQWRDAVAVVLAAPQTEAVAMPPFEFDRYINGRLMAEGVTIERAIPLAQAMVKAAAIASRGPHGEVPVLVLRSNPEKAR